MASLSTQTENTSTDGTNTAPIAINGPNFALSARPLLKNLSLTPRVLSSHLTLLATILAMAQQLKVGQIMVVTLHILNADLHLPSLIEAYFLNHTLHHLLLISRISVLVLNDKTMGKLLFQGPAENGLHQSSMVVSIIRPVPFKGLSAISPLA
ncbi:hypothetical protein NE237_000239 [Protea cynaroides]|uniref:Uncharacterized protein n=1 Tax=Protea cynaroides TaxID=273540 RepID=A0A9Q0QX00_9MAGN|nr:hypothetical protein NE237_000239 [Protea cynaroides]